ncbi:MAG: alkaline phosphatase, partial [Ferruginibacter sp.]
MKLFSAFLFFLVIGCSTLLFAQPAFYTVANAHSHNDYNQHSPYFQAYTEGFGSIEADIHLRNGALIVGHDS